MAQGKRVGLWELRRQFCWALRFAWWPECDEKRLVRERGWHSPLRAAGEALNVLSELVAVHGSKRGAAVDAWSKRFGLDTFPWIYENASAALQLWEVAPRARDARVFFPPDPVISVIAGEKVEVYPQWVEMEPGDFTESGFGVAAALERRAEVIRSVHQPPEIDELTVKVVRKRVLAQSWSQIGRTTTIVDRIAALEHE